MEGEGSRQPRNPNLSLLSSPQRDVSKLRFKKQPITASGGGESLTTAKEAMAFVRKHGVVLASAKGAVPRLTEMIVGQPIQGSWWSHPKSHHIFAVLQAVTESQEILLCRLVDGKLTLVHRRLWPALVRVAKRFPEAHIAQVREVHTASGRHVNLEVAFPKWVPAEVKQQAKSISERDALIALGPWTPLP
jgi:hypothetical protein